MRKSNVLYLLLGMGIGVGSSYLYFKRSNDAALDSIIKDYEKLLHQLQNKEYFSNDNDDFEEEIPHADYGMTVDKPNTQDIYRKGMAKKVDYAAIKPSISELMAEKVLYPEEDETEQEMEDRLAYEEVEPVIKNVFDQDARPFVITLEQYGNDNEIVDTESLVYYSEDNVLVDNNEIPIDNEDYVIGDALNNFGNGSQDPDIVYVRNVKTGCDYDVIRVHGSYQELILGVVHAEEAPPHKSRRNDGQI